MINRPITHSLVVGALALGNAATASAQLPTAKFVTVDLNQVFNEYYKTPVASARLKDAATSFAKEHEEMMAEFKKQVEELNTLRADSVNTAFTPEVREQKSKAVTEKLQAVQKGEKDIREFEQSHRKMLDEQSQRMRQGILREITDVIQKEARDAGYTLVVDKSGNSINQVPVIIYSPDTIEITAEIIKILNKNAPKAIVEPPKPAPKPTEPPKPEPKKEDKK